VKKTADAGRPRQRDKEEERTKAHKFGAGTAWKKLGALGRKTPGDMGSKKVVNGKKIPTQAPEHLTSR